MIQSIPRRTTGEEGEASFGGHRDSIGGSLDCRQLDQPGLVLEKVKALGVPDNLIRDQEELASSDLGRVGNSYPTVNLWFKAAPDGVALHSDQMREAAGSEEGWKATVMAGKAVALSAYELLTHPEKVKTIQEQFNKMKGGDKK